MAYISFQPDAHFQSLLWTGNATNARAMTNDGNSTLQPDLVWIKCRSDGNWHDLTDSTRGVYKSIYTNTASAQVTATDSLQAFDSNGFTIGDNDQVNDNTETFVGWQWKANGGTTSSNGDGSLTSTVQVDSTAGYSIAQVNVGGSTGTTFGHGLGDTPDFCIMKNIDSSESWYTFFPRIFGTNKSSPINGTSDFGTVSGFSGMNATTITQGQGNNDDYIVYSWKRVKGYSSFLRYKGNGNADGPFVYTGFKPRLLIVKGDSSGREWAMLGGKVNPYNPSTRVIVASSALAEDTSADNNFDFLSNGFKVRSASNNYNNSSVYYAVAAFAENPFVSSNGIPSTAR